MEDEQVTVTPAHRRVMGRELYELYGKALSSRNIEIDEWADLGEDEQEAWDSLASQVLMEEYLG